MAACDIEGGAGQQPGRIQHRQGRGIGRHQERDLGAYQAHRIAASYRQPVDDAGVLPARTEIPLLVPPDASPLPVLDSTRLLARAAFDVASSHRALPTWCGGPVVDCLPALAPGETTTGGA